MCGISGIINFNKKSVEESSLKKMMGEMKHRGPDDDGVFIEENIGFGFVRLSIIDLSDAGHQPMFDKSGRFMIIHNGEVFNYIELRNELLSKGYSFSSNTDTEVILYSFIEWGPACLEKFNGMWAFCIYDRESSKLFLSRDRYGIKPLYYHLDENRFVFCSEIQPILSKIQDKAIPNEQIIFDYLVFNRTDHSDETFFKDIYKLGHGNYLSIDLNPAKDHFINIPWTSTKIDSNKATIYKGKWYDLKTEVLKSEPFDSPEEYLEMFRSSINLRLRSDVPIGVCFSGGLDSSSIASILLENENQKNLNSFSAIYGSGKRGDESEFISQYDNRIKNMHFTSPNSSDFLNDITRFTKLHTEPFPSTSIYAQYKVMELAKEHSVVTLDGQGADETLAGYHYFFGYYFKDLLKKISIGKLTKEALGYYKNHNSTYALKVMAFLFLPKKIQINSQLNRRGYINTKFASKYSHSSMIPKNLYDIDSLNNSLLSHYEYKLEHLLKWEDKNSMFFSLESRVPFLDYRLVHKTLSLPSSNMIEKGITKKILRDSMYGIVPEKIRMRKDKIGFESPEASWFREKSFNKFISDIINSESFKSRDFINSKSAKSLYDNHLNNKIDVSNEIWKMINLELWFRQFID
tara:strand:+ start:28081 stop:29976 length:1896 start_codon:yes stop_codon:yes gene_type:complete